MGGRNVAAESAVMTDATNMDMSNPSLCSKPFQLYSPEAKYTFYSTRTDLRQGSTLLALLAAGEDGERDEGLLSGDDEPFWLDVTAPNGEDLAKLAVQFGMHPLSIEDIQMKDSREKCEVFERYLFVCIKTCDQKFLTSGSTGPRRASKDSSYAGEMIEQATIYMLLFQNYIISIHHEPIPHIRRVVRRLYSLRTMWQMTGDWVLYSLFDDTVDEFLPQMHILQLEVDIIDELVLFLTHNEQSDMLVRIGRARKRVTHLLRLLKPKAEILKILTKRCAEYLREHTLIYLRDVNDHVLTNLQNLEQYSETLNRSHSNYLAQISIELNEASNRMTVVMNKLTAAAALFLPFSLISGIWGMNVPVPGQPGVSGIQPLIPFFTMLSIMAVMMGVMYYIGHRYDWW